MFQRIVLVSIVHLSAYHPGWRLQFGPSAVEVPLGGEEAGEFVVPLEGEEMETEEDFGMDTVGDMDVDDDEDGGNDSDFSDDSDFSHAGCVNHEGFFTYDDIVIYLANMYAMLEGERVVRGRVVDALAKKMTFISEVMQDRQKEQLRIALSNEGASEEVISRVTTAMSSADPFYDSHHKNAPGDLFTSKHLRKEYYKRHFKYISPIEINLKKNPQNREETIQYVPLQETVKVLLEDESVQREIDDSFDRDCADTSVLSDYPSGSVFRVGNNPQKRIDLLLFMDAFLCVNPLGSAKNDPKYKMTGMYMTLGNLRPHLRSFLRSMRSVQIFADSPLKGDDKDTERRYM